LAVDAIGKQAGIVHRDIKPENIVGGNVIDFGIAVDADEGGVMER
jgi:serine/threonine protein kinase